MATVRKKRKKNTNYEIRSVEKWISWLKGWNDALQKTCHSKVSITKAQMNSLKMLTRSVSVGQRLIWLMIFRNQMFLLFQIKSIRLNWWWPKTTNIIDFIRKSDHFLIRNQSIDTVCSSKYKRIFYLNRWTVLRQMQIFNGNAVHLMCVYTVNSYEIYLRNMTREKTTFVWNNMHIEVDLALRLFIFKTKHKLAFFVKNERSIDRLVHFGYQPLKLAPININSATKKNYCACPKWRRFL